MVPKHCLDLFEKNFKSFPTQIVLENVDMGYLNKMVSKSHELWSYSEVKENKKIIKIERLVEYDSTGIYIYIKNSDLSSVVFLTTQTKNNITEFSVNNLIKNSK